MTADTLQPTTRLQYQASIDRPRLQLPDGGRVAVFIVVNVEDWDNARLIAAAPEMLEVAKAIDRMQGALLQQSA